MKAGRTQKRKGDHIRINLEENVRSGLTTGLERYQIPHQALPEINLEDISLSTKLFGKKISAPLLISSMTGGTEEAVQINQNLARAAQEFSLPMGVGSQRAALENPETASSFQIRDTAPDIPVLANLGAVQLNYGVSPADCQAAVDMIGADGFILHLNPLQEAVQPEGDTDFSALVEKITAVCEELTVPVIIKEVGWGISSRSARLIAQTGAAAVDVAGAGGTSWSEVEMHRSETELQRQTAASFIDWGIPTAESILQVKKAAPDLIIFASGGLRNGVDIAKCIALGADLGGSASPFLKAAAQSPQAVREVILQFTRELKISMFAAGVRDLTALKALQLLTIQR